jgi:hypothetical protein
MMTTHTAERTDDVNKTMAAADLPPALAAELAAITSVRRARGLARLALRAAAVARNLGALNLSVKWSTWAARRRVAEINGALGRAGIARRLKGMI